MQVQEARLGVRVVALRPPVAERIAGRSPRLFAVSIVQVTRERGSRGIKPLGDVAALVEGVKDAAAAGLGASVPGQKAAAEGVGRKHFAAAVQLAHRVPAVVEVKGGARAVGLPRPQAVGAVSRPPVQARDERQPVLRIEDQRVRRVGRRATLCSSSEDVSNIARCTK